MVEIVYNLENEKYRAKKEFVSISELNLFSRAPCLYEHQVLHGYRKQQSKAMEEGTYLHACVLEPKIWKQFFERIPEGTDFRTLPGKIYKEQMEQDKALGIEHIKHDIYDNTIACRSELIRHPEIKYRHEKIISEISFFDESYFNTKVKARIDGYIESEGLVIDLKTTKDAKNFSKSIIDYGYHRQAAFYLDMAERAFSRKLKWQWWVVETEAPHLNAVYEPDEDMLTIGRIEYEKILSEFKKCRSVGLYPGLETKIKKLSLPQWYLNKTETLNG